MLVKPNQNSGIGFFLSLVAICKPKIKMTHTTFASWDIADQGILQSNGQGYLWLEMQYLTSEEWLQVLE